MTGYMQPRAGLGAISRQPFRPGMWQGFKSGNINNTYIQNNFYGQSVFSGHQYGYANNYGQYSGEPHEMSWWGKAAMGIGLAGKLAGIITNLFKKDNSDEVDENGGPETDTGNQPVNLNEEVYEPEGNTPVATNTEAGGGSTLHETTETPTETPVPTTTHDDSEELGGGGTSLNEAMNSLSSLVCRDNSGKTANISGDFKITQAGKDGEVPKEFTITDKSSGVAHTYKYELVEVRDGKPIYKCVSMNGNPATSSNEYTLEMSADGTPELVQYDNQKNYGTGLKFGEIPTPEPTPEPTPAIDKPKIEYVADWFGGNNNPDLTDLRHT